jgi:hypothetical protein
MKSIASMLAIIALGFGLLGCPSSGGGGGGQYLSLCGVDDRGRFRCGRQTLYFDTRDYGWNGSIHIGGIRRSLAKWAISQCRHRCRMRYSRHGRQLYCGFQCDG